MSDLIDQRGKGQANQVSNGPGRDKEEKFDAYLQPSQNSYGPGNMSSPGVAENSFLPNYFTPSMSFNYMGQGMNEGAWSNGGDQPMFSMSTYDYNGMFNSFGFPPYGWDYSANDYWGTVGQGRKDARPYSDTEYYQPDMMGGDPYMMNGELDHDINNVDQGLKGMSIGGDKNMGENGPSDMGVDSNVSGNVAPPMQTAMSSAPKKTSWAAIASQPARPQPMKRLIPRAPANPKQQHNMDIGTWDNNRGGNLGNKQPPPQRQTWSAPRRQMASTNSFSSGTTSGASNNNQSNSNGNAGYNNTAAGAAAPVGKNNPVLEKLRSANMYNPKEFNLNPKGARYFIIKSYSEDDIHRSIKYSIWCSTEHGNKRLDSAYRERESKGPIYLFYSVNGSGHFCGMAQMMSAVDYNSSSGVWAQDKWKGVFEVKWIYVKDVPNGSLRHIRLENNENKPVTNSRDTQEVPPEKGKQVLKILHNYHHNTSIFDDFIHYEKRQEEDQTKDPVAGPPPPQQRPPQGHSNSQKERPERRPRQN
ncbi:hypothetical protein SNE40_006074 [Patella caerulea]|uniref:YTH domain-containing protein n=1 Tax=Patella caerulea TaxID=87958 RepID=A0AAN8K785_PATCE